MKQRLTRFTGNTCSKPVLLPLDAPVCAAPVPGAPDAAKTPPLAQWLDFTGTPENFRELLRSRALPPALWRRALRAPRFPVAQSGENYLLLGIPLRNSWEAPHAGYTLLLVLAGEVVSFSEKDDHLHDRALRLLAEGDAKGIHDAAGLFIYLLDSILEDNIRHYIETRTRTEVLSEKVSAAVNALPAPEFEHEIRHTRRQANRLINQFHDTVFGLSELIAALPHPFVTPDARSRLRGLAETQTHLADSLRQLAHRLDDLEQHCHYLLQQQMDRRITRLTALSAIFLPLTLITGIYGMNFKIMPGLERPYGFSLSILAMVTLAAGLWWFLSRRDWFR